ncbi:PAS domain-containing protein [Natronobacterium texcoconense]|uniref:histidine kinase n=1 Tax=Natronobacterium texcoconense TaxID=1095778 RepID=A0A1H1BB17_NATTX|nr:PAS domain-containing protein [Natronobacterium texcoconense]SDQ49060.1 PAS domain S-box-containing protein [Natronobacterium texcoconense]
MSERTEPSDTESGFWTAGDEETVLQSFRTLVETIDGGVFQLDETDRLVAVDDTLLEATAYAREELLGEHVSTLLTEPKRLEQVPAAGVNEAASLEVTILTAAGEPISATLRLKDLDGEGVDGAIGVVRDLAESNERAGSIPPIEAATTVLDEADVGVFVLDASFDVAWINEPTERYFGLERSAVLGRDKRRLIEETIQERVAEPDAFAETVTATYDDNSYVERFECRVTPDEDREERWLEHWSKPIEHGRYAGGRIELYYDVTDQHERFVQLRRLNEAIRTWLDRDSREAVADVASRHVRNILGLEINAIYLYDEETATLEPAGWSDPAEELIGDHPRFSEGEGIAWRVFESGESRIYDDVTADASVFNPETVIRSEICLPIGEQGVLLAGSPEPAVFDEGDLSLANLAASTLEAIFDRIRNERMLEYERDRVEELLETEVSEVFGRISDGFYALDEDWRFTYVNERAEELLGHSSEELVGNVIWDVFPGATRSDLMGRYHEAMASQEPVSWERYSQTLDIWMEIQAYPSESGLSVYFRDITERKENRRRLEASEERYRTLVENFPDGVVTLFDDELRYTAAGGELLDELQIGDGVTVGQTIYEQYPDEFAAEIEPQFRAALEGEERSFEVNYRGRVLSAHTLPITIGGSVDAGMLVVQDVTERHDYHRQLEASNERLEQFAYAASHDLQEPLRMVSSYLQLIERRYENDLDDDGQEFLEYAVDGAERMKEMIDGLLEYSRVESRGKPLEPVDLECVLEDIREDLALQIEDADADVTVESLPRVLGDAGQLRRLFQNLLSNAIVYSGDEPPVIQVSAERVGDDWAITVRDEGIGIDLDQQERIFEVFQRLHSQEEQPGTGIGLALCRRIVERHGGEIRVDSEPGEGSAFVVTLPAVDGV